jgi:hypothetical protein
MEKEELIILLTLFCEVKKRKFPKIEPVVEKIAEFAAIQERKNLKELREFILSFQSGKMIPETKILNTHVKDLVAIINQFEK